MSGAVYAYEYDGTNWVQRQKLNETGTSADSLFGSGIALHGSWALINGQGQSAWMYHYEDSSWVLRQVLQPDSGGFSQQIALYADMAILTAQHAGADTSWSRLVYYRLEEGVWVKKQQIPAPEGEYSYGQMVALQHDRLVVGSPTEQRAYLYQLSDSLWQLTQTIADTSGGESWGISLSLYDDWLAIAHQNSCQLFHYSDGAFEWVQAVEAPAAPIYHPLEVALRNGILAVANYAYNDAEGGLYLYHYNGHRWGGQQFYAGMQAGEGMGFSLAWSEHQLWAGSRNGQKVQLLNRPQTPYFVSAASGQGPGSLYEVVANAPEGAVVFFDLALLGDTLTLDQGPVSIGRHIQLKAPAHESVVIRGNAQLFSIDSAAEVYMEGLILQNGQAAQGGAIWNAGRLEVNRCTFRANEAEKGGAIGNAGVLLVRNCLFYENTASQQGGSLYSEGIIDITDSWLHHSQAPRGGAVFSSAPMTLYGTTISHSLATEGGGIYGTDSLRITNCTFSLNAAQRGGGIYFNANFLLIRSCTIAANTAHLWGGGLAFHHDDTFFFTQNTLIANNEAPESPDMYIPGGEWFSLGHNLLGKFTTGSPNAMPSDTIGTLSQPIEPYLDSLRDNGGPTPTIGLFYCSPARDKGNADGLAFDQRGQPREAAADIGAFEGFNTSDSGTLVSNTNSSGPGSFSYAVAHAQAGDTIRFDFCLADQHIVLDSSTLHLKNGMVIMAQAESPTHIVIPQRSTPAFVVNQGDTASFMHLTFSTTAIEAPLFTNYGSLTVAHCEFSGSLGPRGSLFQDQGDFFLLKSTYLHHLTARGLPPLQLASSRVRIAYCTFEQDSSSTYLVELADSTLAEIQACAVRGQQHGFLNNRSECILEQCSFESNENGLFALLHNSGIISMDSASFTNNNQQHPTPFSIIENEGLLEICNSLFQGNESFLSGGVIRSMDTLLIAGCHFLENRARSENADGGAIWNEGYTSITNTHFERQVAGNRGGGLALFGPASLSECNFTQNKAFTGGAMYASDSLMAENCIFSINGYFLGEQQYGYQWQGGAATLGGAATFTNCWFENNEAEEGNAIFVQPHSRGNSIQSCTFWDHGRTGTGVVLVQGGLRINNSSFFASFVPAVRAQPSGQITLTNNTFTINEIALLNEGSMRLQNNLIAENWTHDLAPGTQPYESDGYNLIGMLEEGAPFLATSTDLTGSLAQPLNPLLGQPEFERPYKAFAPLLEGSPAINVGNSAGEAFDQRGLPRDARPDIGAYEYKATWNCVFSFVEADTPGICDPATQTYIQPIRLYYLNAPASGSLLLALTSPTYADTLLLPVGQDSVLLTLPVGSGTYHLQGWFTDSVQCAFEQHDFFTAPEACGQPEPQLLYRINVGGIELPDSLLNWSPDKEQSPSPYVNAATSNNTTGWDQDQNIDNPTQAPTQMLGTHRWDGPWGEEMKWSFPVNNGDYLIHLYFAEIKTQSAYAGARVFDVWVEDSLMLNDLDVYGAVGFRAALQHTLEVNVQDELLEIELRRVAGNPMISGIEVFGHEGAFRLAPPVTDFELYPNPVEDVLTLHAPWQGEALIIIHNLMGQRVYESRQQLRPKQQLHIGQLPKGSYQLWIQQGNKRAQMRFVKQ